MVVFPQILWLILCSQFSFVMGAPFFAHLILNLIALIIIGEAYKLCSSSLCNFMHLVLLLACWIQMFSLATSSHTSSTLLLPLQQKTKFYTYNNTTRSTIFIYILMFLFVWFTYLIIMTHNGSQAGKSTLVPHLCSPIHGAASYKGAIMVEQAVAYFFRMASEDTYSTANSTTYIQVH